MIQTPKKGVQNYSEQMQRSVVGEFCRIQTEAGKAGCSHNWLKEFRPKVGICPHKQDYCDTCAKSKAELHAKQTTLNRLRQTGSVSVESQQQLEADIKSIKDTHEAHHTEADKSHQTDLTKCRKEKMKILNKKRWQK